MGFALPTIIVASVVIMMLLLVVASATTSIREGLYAQYYRRLAREAAESGVVYASKCLEQNNELAQWSNAAKLRPDTNCQGNSVTGRSRYVLHVGNVRSTFEVDEPQRREGNIQRVVVIGRTEIFRTTDNSLWKSYEYRLAGQTGLSTLLDSVTFGYASGNPNGAFFTTIDEFGRPNSAGFNAFGQLGLGNTTDTLRPGRFSLPANKRVVRTYTNFLSHGRNLFALTDTGEVWGAGLNNEGQLGNPAATDQHVSSPVQFRLPASDAVATFVAPLGEVTFVVTANGNVYAAGTNEKGVAGVNSSASSIRTPTKLTFPEKIRGDTASWAVDSRTAYAIGESGKLYGWGNNFFGQLAQNDINERHAPVQIGTFGMPGKPKAVQVVFDGDTMYVRDSNGALYSAGKTNFGQAGVATFRLRNMQSKKCLSASGRIAKTEDCSAGANQRWSFERTSNTVRVESNPAASSDTCLTSTGANFAHPEMSRCPTSGASPSQKYDFRYVPGSPDYTYLSNSSDIGGRGKCVIESNSSTGETELTDCRYILNFLWYVYNPTLEQITSSGVVDVSTDQYFATLVRSDGRVQTWGLNTGALGNGVSAANPFDPDRYKRQMYNPTPVEFKLPAGARATTSWTTSGGLDPNVANVFVVTTDGRVFGAGSNTWGQLGIGRFGGIYATPQQMLVLGTGGNNALYVRSGHGTAVVYTSNRKVFTVGNNSNGQLGDDTTNNNATPQANKNTNSQRRVLFY